jgi:hypothetical protein
MDIYDIPYDIIKKFLDDNNVKYSDYKTKKKAYELAFDLINNSATIHKHKIIIEWMKAYNVINNNIDIYTEKELLSLSHNELKKLAESLGMKTTNINSIRNILSYLHKYTKNSNLDFASHRDLFKRLILNSDLDTIMNLIEANKNTKYEKEFEELILQLQPEFLNEYINNFWEIQHMYYIEERIRPYFLYLLYTGNLKLLEGAIRVLRSPIENEIDSDYGNDVYAKLGYDILSDYFYFSDNKITNFDQNLMINYLSLIPKNFNYKNFDIITKHILEDWPDTNNIIKVLLLIFRAAMKLKNDIIIHRIINLIPIYLKLSDIIYNPRNLINQYQLIDYKLLNTFNKEFDYIIPKKGNSEYRKNLFKK